MKKVFAVFVAFVFIASLAYATATQETLDARAVPVSMYGKTAGGTVTGLVVSASGGLTPAPAGTVVSEYTTVALTAAAADYTTSVSDDWKMEWVTVKASEAITETVTIKIVSDYSTTHNTTIASQALVAETDFYYHPDGGLVLQDGDEIEVTVTNNNTTGSVYVAIQGQE
ncbi:hypothetical protein [Candidatus Magnetobacterium casense]|uniref:Secreted protein n=1 Tax=Candidatus Magnetobacterium casense TaxID=1455061 RepID=A0ABS6RX70_9BACT|nr:hypothetical protein [Candidatus Magnetobacterium casensis]MBV6341032.1 hypothetical protein [Candidatus Magnetobacterium casensis]